ncbi:FtsK/SpoIIIE domain-containing protein [Kocuria rhizophila]|uniref:FtsK/SpoIIIE domain-containing protein n=1 Tax=Kocuria rhizophila TaxID=72000 RepID=UPI003D3486BA
MTAATVIGPVVSLLMLIGGWFVAGSCDEHAQPRRALVTFGQWLTIGGFVVGLVSLPTDLDPVHASSALAVLLLVGLILMRGAGRNAIGWTSASEILTAAVMLSWTTPRRALWSSAALGVGISLAAWLTAHEWQLPGLVGALVALAPARWWLKHGWDREHAQTGVERSLAGALAGGSEWNTHEATLRGAPIKLRFEDGRVPRRVTFALPPSWRASSEDTLRDDVRKRLDEWGRPWGVVVNNSKREVVAERAAQLPTTVTIPSTTSWEWIAANAPSPLALYLGTGQDPESGEHFPVWWDPDASDPHTLIGGRTKTGKSVCLRLLVGQAVMRGWLVVICDPKGADFAWAGRLPGVLYFSGDEAVYGLAEACGEMDERRGWVARYVWSGEEGADEEPDLLKIVEQPYRPCLVILDEAAEAAGIGDPDVQKQTKANMSRLARLSRAAGMVCAFATQRPDASFLPGETKANLGTRIMFLSDGDSTMTQMILDLALKTLNRLTSNVRGRGRVLISGEHPVETQGAFVTVSEIKKRVPMLPADDLEPVRFAPEPEWRRVLRGDDPSGPAPVNEVSANPDSRTAMRTALTDDSIPVPDGRAPSADGYPTPPPGEPTPHTLEALDFDPFESFDDER